MTPDIVQAYWAGLAAGCAALTVLGVRWFGRYVARELLDGVDRRINGRIDASLDAFATKLDSNTSAVLDEVRSSAQSGRVTARVLAHHVRWAASQPTDGTPDPSLDHLDDLDAVTRHPTHGGPHV